MVVQDDGRNGEKFSTFAVKAMQWSDHRYVIICLAWSVNNYWSINRFRMRHKQCFIYPKLLQYWAYSFSFLHIPWCIHVVFSRLFFLFDVSFCITFCYAIRFSCWSKWHYITHIQKHCYTDIKKKWWENKRNIKWVLSLYFQKQLRSLTSSFL